MKKSMMSFAVMAVLSGGCLYAADLPKLAVIDYVAVFQQVPQGNGVLASMKADLEPKVAALKVEQKKIQQQMIDLDKSAPTMTKDDLEKQKKSLLEQQMAFQKQVTGLQKDEMEKEETAAGQFNDAINAAISSVAKDQHLTMVLNKQAVPYAADGTDVSDKVIAIMKKPKVIAS